MSKFIGKKCVIRTERAGVFFGTLEEFDSVTRMATLCGCRRLWYWDGAASLSQLAMDGVLKPRNCKFTVSVPAMQVMNVIEIIPATAKAIECIESVEQWKM